MGEVEEEDRGVRQLVSGRVSVCGRGESGWNGAETSRHGRGSDEPACRVVGDGRLLDTKDRIV